MQSNYRGHARLGWALNPMTDPFIIKRRMRQREEGHGKIETDWYDTSTGQRTLGIAETHQKLGRGK